MTSLTLSRYTINSYFTLLVDANSITLTSSPELNNSICPQAIELTCIGTNVPFTMQWRLNDTVHIHTLEITDQLISLSTLLYLALRHESPVYLQIRMVFQ